MRPARLLGMLLPGLMLACGSNVDADAPPAPVQSTTLRGQISAGTDVAGTRAAIVWWITDTGRPYDKHVGEVPFRVEQGATSFEIDVPPPTSWLVPSVDGMGFARGSLVLYEDKNQNGKLDLVDPAVTSEYVDRIVAENTTLEILYIDGQIPGPPWRPFIESTDGSVPATGFNLVFSDWCANGRGPEGPCSEGRLSYKPADTPIVLSSELTPSSPEVMCELSQIPTNYDPNRPTPTVHPVGEMPATFPSNSEPYVFCNENMGPEEDVPPRMYTHYKCKTPSRACAFMWTGMTAEWCTGDTYTLAPGAPFPAGWPCSQH